MTSPGCYSGREHIYERARKPQKVKTAPPRGKRYRCAVCRRRSPKKVSEAPWYCPEHAGHQRGMRKVHINNEVWQYRVGQKSIVILEPDLTKHVVDLSTFTGLSWYALERMAWKNSGVQITPQEIKDYILEHYK